MKKILSLILLGFLSCNGNGGNEPPPTTTTTMPPTPETCAEKCEPFQWAEVNEQCRCSSDYYAEAKAADLHQEALNWDARLIGDGVRNPNYAFEKCGENVLPFGGFETWPEIFAVSARSQAAKDKLFGPENRVGYYHNLLKPNRHGFAGRSMVYKPEARPWFEEARALLNGTGGNSNPNGPVSKLNGIKKACDEM